MPSNKARWFLNIKRRLSVLFYQGLKLKRTWIEINLDNLKFNFFKIKNVVEPKCKVMGIVKADAYGHGDKIISEHLIDYGVDWLGVSNIEEALSLRRGGVKIPILVLGYTPPNLANVLFQYNITQTIFSFEYANQISQQALKQGVTVQTHLKIDTGMNRIGFKTDEENFDFKELLKLYQLPSLIFSGIFTHFAVADGETLEDEKYTIYQYDLFVKTCNYLTKCGIDVGLRHCCNSAATIKYPYMHLDMVRPGIVLYGPYIPVDMSLKPVMVLKTKISMVKNLNKDETISYGRRFKANSPIKVATICIGYADGYNRLLSNVGSVEVKNKTAKILGTICMDQSMIDVTNIPDVCAGNEVTVWGDECCNLNNIAKLIGTIPYELLCNVSKRVPRLYLKNNKEYAFVDYIASI